MLRVFKGTVKTEGIWPCQLAFFFVNGIFREKIALTRPLAAKGKDSFPFVYVLDVNPGDFAVLYLSGQRVELTETDIDTSKMGNLWYGRFLEMCQDLKASGYTIEEFPELAYYLNFEHQPPEAPNELKKD